MIWLTVKASTKYKGLQNFGVARISGSMIRSYNKIILMFEEIRQELFIDYKNKIAHVSNLIIYFKASFTVKYSISIRRTML